MGKIVFDNVKIDAKSGGNIKNVDFYMTNSTANFTEDSFNVSTDESVAIIEKYLKSKQGDKLAEVIIALKQAKPEQREGILKSIIPEISSLIKALNFQDINQYIEFLCGVDIAKYFNR